MHPENVHIFFEGIKASDAIEGYIRDELENLQDMDEVMTSVNITVLKQGEKRFSGDPFRLRVRLTTDGSPDINIYHDPGTGRRHDAMRIAVRDTFRIVRRRLEDRVRRQQKKAR
jgi:hypothetical protein